MTSRSSVSYEERAAVHPSPLVQKIFRIAEAKKSNLIISADLRTTRELLDLADRVGPHIAGFKTHIDIVSDFGSETIDGLKELAAKHNFFIFEDRKFVDIGNTVQMQYHRGALRISEWADVVNASILAGPGIIDAMADMSKDETFTALGPRGCLILAEMTSKGSLATGDYTKSSIQIARQHPDFIIGFVSLTSLNQLDAGEPVDGEDFVVFTTGVNRSTKGDSMGQQYNTPARAVAGGSDFIICGRGIYAAPDPVESAKLYHAEGWQAYVERINKAPTSKA